MQIPKNPKKRPNRAKRKKRPVSLMIPESYYDYIMNYYGKSFRTSLDTTVAHYLTNVALKNFFNQSRLYKGFMRKHGEKYELEERQF